MRMNGGIILALTAALVAGACAPAATTGEAGPGGVRPAQTRFTTQATLFIAQAESATGEQQQQLFQRALETSLQGIQAAPQNPQHYYLAGVAHAGLDHFESADSMWDRALELYPAYEPEVLVAREQAWAQAFNAGVNAYNAGNMQDAIRHWNRANQIFDRRPEAYFNLAAIYSQEQQYDRAIEAFQAAVASLDRAPGRELTEEEQAERQESREGALQNLGNLLLFTEQFAEAERVFRQLTELQPESVTAQSHLATSLARQGRRDDAMQVYQRLLAMPNLPASDLMNVGIGLFQSQEYPQAADAFRRLTEMQPNNRDAWYNYVNALYAQERFRDLIPVAERLLQLDPLNENTHLILIRSLRDTQQQQRALHFAEQNQALPIHLDDLQMRVDQNRAILRGNASPGRARAGTPVRLEFTFFGETGQTLGTEVVSVNAPAANQTTPVEVSVTTQTPPIGYQYRVLP